MQRKPASETMIIVAVMMGTIMAAVDSTIVLLALKNITVDLNTTIETSIWVILIYLLVTAVLTTQMGSVGDNFGRSRIFNIGFVIFTIASIASGFSRPFLGLSGIQFLITMRAFQAVGASMLQSTSSAIISDMIPGHRRGRAFGFTAMGWNIGGTLGIVLGGIITTYLGWQFVFYINGPIGIAGYLISMVYIHDNVRQRKKIDFVGIVTLALALLSLSYGALKISTGANTVQILAYFAIGVLFSLIFIINELKTDHPLVDFKAFKSRMLGLSLLATYFQATGYLAVVFILILYLQGVRNLNPLAASLYLVPGYIIASFLAPKMGSIADKIGPTILATVGIFLMMMGVIIYFTLTTSSNLLILIAGSIVAGIGGSMFWPSNIKAVMGASDSKIYGSIGGLQRTLSNIGTLTSFVLALTIASLTIQRGLVYSIFVYGAGNELTHSNALLLMDGFRSAFIVSITILLIAGLLSYSRGKLKHHSENTGEKQQTFTSTE